MQCMYCINLCYCIFVNNAVGAGFYEQVLIVLFLSDLFANYHIIGLVY